MKISIGDTVNFQLKSGNETVKAVGSVKEIRQYGGFTDYKVTASETEEVWVRKVKKVDNK